MIKPTVGRVVWYRPTVHDVNTLGMFAYKDSDQPMAATVVFVHSERMVNLSIVDHKGRQFEKTSVAMVQDGETVPAYGGYAEWMPYQKGQAAKADESQIKVDVLTGPHPPHGQANQSDCPHAAPHRNCSSCVADPCPIGLGKAGAGC